MRRLRRRWVLLLAAVGALAAAIGIGWSSARSQDRVWWFPDNTMLALEGITYGKTHRITHGTWWQKALLPILPPRARQSFEQRFGCAMAGYTSARPDTLVLWLYQRTPARGMSGGGSFRRTRSVVYDEHGHEYETGGRGHSMFLPFAPGETLGAVEVPVFPRRGKTIGVRIYQQGRDGQWARVASCTVPNPAAGPYPTWNPQPLPITGRAAGLAVTMTELTPGVTNKEIPRVARGREAAWTRATFRLSDPELQRAAWEPVGVEISDATGNVWTPRACFGERGSGEARLYFVGAPWAEEATWKLRVEFARAAGYAPMELWTVRGIPVPGLGGHCRLWQSTSKNGVTIAHVGLFVPPKSVPEAGWRRGVPRVQLLLSAPLNGQRVTLVRATNERGEEIPTSEIVRTHSDREYGTELHVPPGSKAVDLTFALHRSRSVTFLAKPPGQ